MNIGDKKGFMENTTKEFKILGKQYRFTNIKDNTLEYTLPGWSNTYQNGRCTESHSVPIETWN